MCNYRYIFIQPIQAVVNLQLHALNNLTSFTSIHFWESSFLNLSAIPVCIMFIHQSPVEVTTSTFFIHSSFNLYFPYITQIVFFIFAIYMHYFSSNLIAAIFMFGNSSMNICCLGIVILMYQNSTSEAVLPNLQN